MQTEYMQSAYRGEKLNFGKIVDCKHHKMERFLEVSLLVLLREQNNHGYGLIEDLNYFGFGDEMNVGSLYRTLRKMEKQNLVSSQWEEGEAGPKKRVYKITGLGVQELDYWIEVMKIRKKRINNLIIRFNQLEGK